MNQGNEKEESRMFRKQWKALLQNIKDPYNMELRASILTGVLQPEKIAIMEEKEFYSKPKKEIVEKK